MSDGTNQNKPPDCADPCYTCKAVQLESENVFRLSDELQTRFAHRMFPLERVGHCLVCVEATLGRRLEPRDFSQGHLATVQAGAQSAALIERIGPLSAVGMATLKHSYIDGVFFTGFDDVTDSLLYRPTKPHSAATYRPSDYMTVGEIGRDGWCLWSVISDPCTILLSRIFDNGSSALHYYYSLGDNDGLRREIGSARYDIPEQFFDELHKLSPCTLVHEFTRHNPEFVLLIEREARLRLAIFQERWRADISSLGDDFWNHPHFIGPMLCGNPSNSTVLTVGAMRCGMDALRRDFIYQNRNGAPGRAPESFRTDFTH